MGKRPYFHGSRKNVWVVFIERLKAIFMLYKGKWL